MEATLLSHEESVIVLIKLPRLQVAAKKDEGATVTTAHANTKNLSPVKNSLFHELMFAFKSLKLPRNASSAGPISLKRVWHRVKEKKTFVRTVMGDKIEPDLERSAHEIRFRAAL